MSRATGAPSGSVYHRFGSRDLLLAKLWVRTVTRFQAGFLSALDDDDLDEAAIGAALHVVRWAREHPHESTVLLMHRRSQLATDWPESWDVRWVRSTPTSTLPSSTTPGAATDRSASFLASCSRWSTSPMPLAGGR